MSDMRIALVAEGKTDFVIIEAALKAILPKPFILTLLQPEDTRPKMGSGWCGVMKWCQEAMLKPGITALADDPTLGFFDLIIIHLDADVAGKSYTDCGSVISEQVSKAGWTDLPCEQPCPPSDASITKLIAVLQSWLGSMEPRDKTVFCIPSKSSETWLAAGVYPHNHALLQDSECADNMAGRLANLPKAQRIKKSVMDYRKQAKHLTANWSEVCSMCSQAAIFQRAILCVVKPDI